jgi:hypothetical protein
MLGSKKLVLAVRWNWLVLIAIFVMLLVLAFALFEKNRAIIVFIASVLAGASALTAAANAMDARSEQQKHARILVALDYVSRWNSPLFYHAKVKSRQAMSLIKTLTGDEDFRNFSKEQSDNLQNLFDAINFFEELSIAIQRDAADSETAKSFFESILSRCWHDTERFIKYRRAEKKNSRLLREFEWLHTQWGD